jgi:hypothetical protein
MRFWNFDRLSEMSPHVTETYRVHQSVPPRRTTSQGVARVVVFSAALMTSHFCVASAGNDMRTGVSIPSSTLVRSSDSPPPLATLFEGRFSDRWTAEREDDLLDRIEAARHMAINPRALRLNVLEVNQRESLKRPPLLTREQISRLPKKARG